METKHLYHYCSNSSFVSIIQSNTIRLSSLSLSNDSQEGKLAQKVLIELANENKISADRIEDIKRAFSLFESSFDGLGFCLSEDPDLLSQWRGYANDGEGIAIGFSTGYLKKLTNKESLSSVRLNKVQYSHKHHLNKLLPIFTKINKLIQDGKLELPSRGGLLIPKSQEGIEKEENRFKAGHMQLVTEVATLLPELFVMKSEAFSEEQEWRLTSLIQKASTNDIDFHARGALITPFKELSLGENTIERIVVGPKNKTPLHVINSLLRTNGIMKAEIIASNSTYR